MADTNIGETIATNLVTDPRLTQIMPGGVNVNQTVLSGGMGVSLEQGAEESAAYVTPWVNVTGFTGDVICVLIVSSNNLQPPSGGVSMDSGDDGNPLVWLRGASTGYAEVIAVRTSTPTTCRLYAPGTGVLTVIKSGVFDLESWTNMQAQNIIYFDGGGLVQASESGYTLPPATTTTLGGIIVGDGLQITAQGRLSVLQQELPIATQDTAGVIKIGQGLRASADGTTSVRLGENLSFDSSGNIQADISGLAPDMSDYYTKTQANATFVTKEYADATYATKSELPDSGGTSYATEDWVTQNFLGKNDYVGYEVQEGSYTYGNLNGGENQQVTVTFSHSFSGSPVVQAGTNQAGVICQVTTANASRFVALLHNTGSSQANVSVNWSAIGEA